MSVLSLLSAVHVLRNKYQFRPKTADAYVPTPFVFHGIRTVVRMGPGPKDTNRHDHLAVMDNKGVHVFREDFKLAATILRKEAKTFQSKN